MSSKNPCGDPYPYQSTLGVASYKLTAEQFKDAKSWVSNCADGASNMVGWCGNDNTYIGDPYPNYPNGGLGGSCPACGSYTWGGPCGCGTIQVPMPGCVPAPLPNWVPAVWPYPTTSTGSLPALIVKGKDKADVLGDFFGPEVHALVVLDETDGGARFVPFMDKLNMIWLQETLNSWAAYDRDTFLAFINSDQTMFFGTKLNKAEVLKRMMKPENPPESLK